MEYVKLSSKRCIRWLGQLESFVSINLDTRLWVSVVGVLEHTYSVVGRLSHVQGSQA